MFALREIINEVSIAKGGDAMLTDLNTPLLLPYWSSRESENTSNDAWGLNFFNGFQLSYLKGNPYAVRCVRAF
jgi:hypothetical protein